MQICTLNITSLLIQTNWDWIPNSFDHYWLHMMKILSSNLSEYMECSNLIWFCWTQYSFLCNKTTLTDYHCMGSAAKIMQINIQTHWNFSNSNFPIRRRHNHSVHNLSYHLNQPLLTSYLYILSFTNLFIYTSYIIIIFYKIK